MDSHHSYGYTLLELLIVIAIFAIGAAIAIPNISQIGQRNKIKLETRQLKEQLAKARATAIETNGRVVVIFDTKGYDIVRETVSKNCTLDAGENCIHITMSDATITANSLPKNSDGKHILQWDERGYPRDSTNSVINTGTLTINGNNLTFKITISPAGNIYISNN